MAVRADIQVLPDYSPRIVLIEAPSTTVTCQDLYDTLRAWEDSPEGQTYDTPIIDAGGKEDLGGGVFVGITATLINARIMFAARDTPIESGVVTSADPTGTVLEDATADFSSITPGEALVINQTDGSKGTVLEILSASSPGRLGVAWLSGGIENDFDLNDAYEVYNIALCGITDGNLVAVDDVGDPIDVSSATFGTQVVRTGSTSAALVEGTGADAAAIADAVWDEDEADHVQAGTFGKAIQDLPSAADVDTELTAQHGSGDWTAPTAAEVAVEVWADATAVDLAQRVLIIKAISANQMVLLPDGTHVVYADNDVDEFMRFVVLDNNDNPPTLPDGLPAKRSKGVLV